MHFGFLNNTGLHNKNCTEMYLPDHHAHDIFQCTIIVFFLAYVTTLNFTLITIIISSRVLRSCCLNMQLVSSFIGNILGGLSLFGNELLYTKNGIPPIGCQYGKDKYFFLYLGVSINVMTTVLNTHYRYENIASMIPNTKKKAMSRKELILRCWLPSWLVSAVIATIASIVQDYFITYQFLMSVVISVIPLSTSITWNILLTRFLHSIMNSTRIIERRESQMGLERATYIVKATIIVHVLILSVGGTATLSLVFIPDQETAIVSVIWVLRIFYVLLFSIEAKLFIRKTPKARKILKNNICKVLMGFCSKEEIASDVREGYNDAELSFVPS